MKNRLISIDQFEEKISLGFAFPMCSQSQSRIAFCPKILKKSTPGFTLLELTVVLLILAILAVLVAIGFDRIRALSPVLVGEQLQSNLAYLRDRALSYQQTIQVVFTPEGYTVTTVGVFFPSNQSNSVSLADQGMYFSNIPFAANTLTFGSNGLPTTTGTLLFSEMDGTHQHSISVLGSGFLVSS